MIRKKIMVSLAAIVFFIAALLLPGHSGADEIQDLRKQLDSLEKKQAELYHSLEEKKSPGLLKAISERVSLGGLVEVEASVDSNDVDGDTTDVVLATVELGFDAEVHERVDAHVLLLWEEDATDPIDMDEGTVTIKVVDGLDFTGGKFYIPFGAFNSHFISDPQTLELGETNETALMLTYGHDLFSVSAGAFNGHLEETGSDDIVEDYFAAVSVTPMEGIEIGAYYTSDIGDSNEMTDTFIGASTVAETVGGVGAYLSLNFGPVTLETEYLGAAKRFQAADLDADSDGRGDRPRAYNIEVAFAISDDIEVAARLEGNRQLPSLPETQYGLAASYGLFEHVAVALEYLHGDFDGPDLTRDLVTAQVAVEF